MRHAQLRIMRACAGRGSRTPGGILYKAVRLMRTARLRHLAGHPAASFRLIDAWQIRLDALKRGRLAACEEASSSEAHAAAVVTGGSGVGCKRSGADCGGSEDGGGDGGGGGDGAAGKAGGAEGRRVVRSRVETSGGRGVMVATA